jgi:hypothetical protein
VATGVHQVRQRQRDRELPVVAPEKKEEPHG